MKLTFFGTKANLDTPSSRHHRHSALEIAYRSTRIVIDCGLDWLDKVMDWRAAAIFVTHAHPDHAFGLQNGAPCPVYAASETWEAIGDYPITQRETIAPRKAVELDGFVFEAFPVIHSLRAPAVGYRMAAGRRSIFYVPDVVDIEDRRAALAGIDIYVGDGSSLTRSLVRHRGDELFGHTTIRAQLGWCGQEGVERALFTHCGSQIIGDERRMQKKLSDMAAERGLEAEFAYDGMELTLR